MNEKKKQSPRYEYEAALINWGLSRLSPPKVKDLLNYCLHALRNKDWVVPCSINKIRDKTKLRPRAVRSVAKALYELGIVAGFVHETFWNNEIECLQLTGEVPKMTPKEANKIIKGVLRDCAEIGRGGGSATFEVWGLPLLRFGFCHYGPSASTSISYLTKSIGKTDDKSSIKKEQKKDMLKEYKRQSSNGGGFSVRVRAYNNLSKLEYAEFKRHDLEVNNQFSAVKEDYKQIEAEPRRS